MLIQDSKSTYYQEKNDKHSVDPVMIVIPSM